MTNTTMSARFAESDFRIGPVLTRTATVLSQHFLIFFGIGVIANVPSVLIGQSSESVAANPTGQGAVFLIVGGVLAFVLSMLSQAVMVHAAFQAMRMRPVSFGESLIVPGLILVTMWFVSTPACVVERTGPWTSLKRSAALTKGHRWKIFGLMILLVIVSLIVAGLLQLVLPQFGSTILVLLGTLLWGALWTSYYSIAVVMTYHDLRVAKEGIDIEQIASVFD
jgi:hypothetical protein